MCPGFFSCKWREPSPSEAVRTDLGKAWNTLPVSVKQILSPLTLTLPGICPCTGVEQVGAMPLAVRKEAERKRESEGEKE